MESTDTEECSLGTAQIRADSVREALRRATGDELEDSDWKFVVESEEEDQGWDTDDDSDGEDAVRVASEDPAEDAEDDAAYGAKTDSSDSSFEVFGNAAARADLARRAAQCVEAAKRKEMPDIYKRGHIIDRPEDWILCTDPSNMLVYNKIPLLVWFPDVRFLRNFVCVAVE